MMLSAIRSRITYVNVVATLVLVFAMTGGALAAKKYLITSTKQISPSVLKSLQGKAGAAGANGVQGPAGAQGAQGSQGPAGAAGAKGDTGEKGKEGAKGVTGAEGSPWTAGGTLPPGKTETGVWSFGGSSPSNTGHVFEHVPISFNIPLPEAIKGEHTEYVEYSGGVRVKTLEGNGKAIVSPDLANCPTEYVEVDEPKAAPGYMCVYQSYIEETVPNSTGLLIAPGFTAGAGVSGAILKFEVEKEDEDPYAQGSWAVTACDPAAVSGPNVCP